VSTEPSNACRQDTSLDPTASGQADGSKQWPCLLALIATPFLPATTARRTCRVRLWEAFLTHLVGLAVICVSYVAFHYQIFLGFWPASWVFDAFASLQGTTPPTIVFLAIGLVISLELLLALLAALLMSWGATDEPLRGSYLHALKRLWLHTGHAALLIVLGTWISIRWFDARDRWVDRTLGSYPTWPAAARTDKNAARRYRQAVSQYNQSFDRLQRSVQTPWYVRFTTYDFFCTAAWAWLFWALLRALGAPRPSRPRVRGDPICQACGYNLTSMGLEQRCPECGEPVVDSIGPNVRPGAIWERQRHRHWWAALGQTRRQAARTPRRFGRTLRLDPTEPAHRSYLALRAAPLFLLGIVVGPAGRLMLDSWLGVEPAVRPWYDYLAGGAPIGLFIVISTVVFVATIASVLGLAYGFWRGRNLMRGTIQAAAYQAHVLVPWTAVATLSFICRAALLRSKITGMWTDAFRVVRANAPLFFYLWLIFVGAILLLYLWRTNKTCQGFQYAAD